MINPFLWIHSTLSQDMVILVEVMLMMVRFCGPFEGAVSISWKTIKHALKLLA